MRLLERVEVAPMVTMLLGVGVEVPIPNWVFVLSIERRVAEERAFGEE